MTDLRSGLTGEAFGWYWKVVCTRSGKQHELYLHANKFEITPTGNLVLFDKDDKPYRAFATGHWNEIATTSCMDGAEMWEEHDYVDE